MPQIIAPLQFRKSVVGTALRTIGLWSDAAEVLVTGTALQESGLRHVRQIGGGPALGLCQMEPRTHEDIWDHFLCGRPRALTDELCHLAGTEGRPNAEILASNSYYAAAMCRVHYLRVKAPLPDVGDIESMAAYWKAHYNTAAGAGRVDEFIANWHAAFPAAASAQG